MTYAEHLEALEHQKKKLTALQAQGNAHHKNELRAALSNLTAAIFWLKAVIVIRSEPDEEG